VTKVTIEQLTRLEGNAKVSIDVEGGTLKDLQFKVMTGPRFFEHLLLNKPAEEAPRISERICGICYANHHLVSVKAVEDAWGVTPPPVANILRRTLNAASFVTSHALHLAFLALPDLMELPARNFIGIMEANPELANMAVKLHEYGNKVVQEIGGRVVHVITAVPGGMTRGLTGDSRYRLLRESRAVLSDAQKVVEAIFNLFESREKDPAEYAGLKTKYMGLVSEGNYEIFDGSVRVKDSKGDIIVEFKPQDYREHFEETSSDHSFTKLPYMKAEGFPDGVVRVGPLARTNIIDGYKWPLARRYQEWYESIYPKFCHDTGAYNLTRTVEFVAALEEVVEGLSDLSITSGNTRIPVKAKAGVGVGIVEAPRGVLLHNYTTDEKGIIKKVNIIAPTTFNHPNIENNLRNWADQNAEKISNEATRDESLWSLEKIVRAYDPCLSCSVHMVEVKLKIDGVEIPVRRIH